MPFSFYHIASQVTFCLLSINWYIHPEIPEGLTLLVVMSDIHSSWLDTASNGQVHHYPLIRPSRRASQPPVQRITPTRILRYNSSRQVFRKPSANQYHLWWSIVIISWSLTCFNNSCSINEMSVLYPTYLTLSQVTGLSLDFIDAVSHVSINYFLIGHQG